MVAVELSLSLSRTVERECFFVFRFDDRRTDTARGRGRRRRGGFVSLIDSVDDAGGRRIRRVEGSVGRALTWIDLNFPSFFKVCARKNLKLIRFRSFVCLLWVWRAFGRSFR
jgi:hypothetical protein